MTLSDVLALETERRIRLSPTYVQTFRKRDQANPRNALSAPPYALPTIEPEAPWHGTLFGYIRRKCRCALCLGINAEYSREKRATRKAAGICGECSLPVLPGLTRCAVHMERNMLAGRGFRSKRRRHLSSHRITAQPSLFQDAGA